MAIRSTRSARTSTVSKTLADLASVLPQGNTSAPAAPAAPKAQGKASPSARDKSKSDLVNGRTPLPAPSLASPVAPKVQEYRAPLLSAVSMLVNADYEANQTLWTACLSFCLEVGPISEKAWDDDIKPLFGQVAKKVKCDAKRLSEFKVFLIGYSNGLRPKGATTFTSYVRLVRKDAGYGVLVAATNRGARPSNTNAPKAPKAPETPKTDGKGLIGAEVAHANAKTSQLDHAQSLLGNREIAAFLVRACETGNRDQLVKYLKAHFPAPKDDAKA